jgi:hypothetical protein
MEIVALVWQHDGLLMLQLVARISAAVIRRSPNVESGSAALCATGSPFHSPYQRHIYAMTTAEDIEKAVEQLAPRELARFRAWFESFDARQFDAAIERDARAGKLDAHAEEALAAHRAGRSYEL